MLLRYFFLCVLLLATTYFQCLFAQTVPQIIASKRKNVPVIEANLNSGIIGVLPYDVPFYIAFPYDKKILSIKSSYRDLEDTCDGASLHSFQHLVDQKEFIYVYVNKPLRPNRNYIFKFVVRRNLENDELNLVSSEIEKQFANFLEISLKSDLDYELQKSDVDKIINNVLVIFTKQLAKKNMKIETGLDVDYHSLIKKSLTNLTDNFKDIFETSLKNLSHNAQFFDKIYLQLDTLLKSNQLKNNNVSMRFMTALRSLRMQVDDDKLISSALAQSYFDAAINSIDAFNQLETTGPMPATMEMLLDDIREELEAIQINAKKFIAAPNTILSPISEQAKIIANVLESAISSEIIVVGDTQDDFDTRSKNYYSADIGVAFFPEIQKASPYLGTNIYFRPINKEAGLNFRDDFGQQFLKRFSILIGITFVSISEPNKRSDLLGSNFNLIAGGGLRVSDGFRINGGCIFYNAQNRNPLISTRKIDAKSFISLSFDLDVQSVFKEIFHPRIPKP